MRLQKYLAEAGIASRRKCEELIISGKVFVNGAPAVIGCNVDPIADTVVIDQKVIQPKEQKVVILFYKPRGVICTSSDPQGRKTVIEFFSDFPERLFTVGRLDYDTEGALLVTNDGDLANLVTHPRHEIEKEYLVLCGGVLKDQERELLEKGVELSDGITAPTAVKILEKQNNSTLFTIVLHEGRNRQVRRMVEAVGHDVRFLKRMRIGALDLKGLLPGQWRYLTADEIQYLRSFNTI